MIGSYKATIVGQIIGAPSGYYGKQTVGYTIALFNDGHFAMTSLIRHDPMPEAPVQTIKGRWIESRDHLKLIAEAGPAGIRPHKVVFTALVKGKNLIEGPSMPLVRRSLLTSR